MSNEWRDLPTMADVAAAQAAGNEIECTGEALWFPWDGNHWDKLMKYRARPRQPKMKKVKSLCWRQDSTGHLTWMDEGTGFVTESGWRRFPSMDVEGVVEDD